MSLATARPAHAFYQKQAAQQPKELSKYDAWLVKAPRGVLENLDGLASINAIEVAAKRPVKHPQLRGFEEKYYRAALEQHVAYETTQGSRA